MKISTRVLPHLALVFILLGLGCAHSRKWNGRDEPFREVQFKLDSSDQVLIRQALEVKIKDCDKNKNSLPQGSKQFCELISSAKDVQPIRVYQPFGRSTWGEMLVTGYYQPEIVCSRVSSEKLTAPLLKTPTDLARIDFTSFGLSPKNLKTDRGYVESLNGVMKFRAVPNRENIMNVAQSKDIIGYCEEVDLFFLQIQGSGLIRWMGTQDVQQVTYAEQNGYKYQAIGKFLKEKISAPLTAEKIKEYLRSLTPEERAKILNLNESYVFFRESDRAVTSSGFTPYAGFTAAVDRKIFKPNSLAFIKFNNPALHRFNTLAWLDDAGGAIKGVDRLDLYLGEGDAVATDAGSLNDLAQIYVIEVGPSTPQAQQTQP